VTATVSISDVVPFDLEPPPAPGRAMLWRNQGDGTFVEVTAEAQLDVGDDFHNPNWVDFDNDGWLDLFVVRRGNVAIGNAPDWLFRNNGDGTFTNVAGLVGVEGMNEGAGQVSAWADYDRNGFLDLFTMACGYGGAVRADCGPEELFRNEGNGNHWLHLHLVGQVSNREGFGAIVSLTAGGRTLVRVHNDGVERYTQDADRLHFGLGANTVVDSIVIDWPSGIHQVVTGIPADQQLTITETWEGNPPVADDVTASGDEDTVIPWTPSVSDPDGDTLTCAIVTQPANGSAAVNPDCSSGSYTPDLNFNGSDSFSYKANDGQVDSNTAVVSVTVNPVNDPPLAVGDSYTTAEDMPLTVAAPGVLANDEDVEGDPLTAVLDSPPANGLLALAPDGSFTFTPTLDFHGMDSFTYHATDTVSDSNLATVTLTVTAVNDPPLAIDDNYSAVEDVPLIVTAPGVLANDGDVDGDPLAAVLDTSPLSGTLALNPDGSFIYTPTLDFLGIDSFTYHATDTISDSNVAAVTLTVTALNDPPLAIDDSYTATEDVPLMVAAPGVLANDEDVEGDPLTAVLDSPPANGLLTLNPDGSFAFTPTLDFYGTDSFTYHATDAISDSNVAVVTMTVTAVNDPPLASDDSYATTEGLPLVVTAPGVLANDGDVDGDALAAVLDSPPLSGTLLLNPDGSFTYTPMLDFHGVDAFTYHATDAISDSNLATVTLTVQARPPHFVYLPLIVKNR
jgi:hypothetical protein